MPFDAALEALRTALSDEVERNRATATREMTASLNNAMRRLRQAESKDEWIRTLNETASSFCDRAAFLSVTSRGFVLDGSEMPLASAPAIANAVESKDTVVAAGIAGEVSEAVLTALNTPRRVWLVPILVRDKAVGVLCAAADETKQDLSAIELLASLASASVVTAPETTVESKPAELVRIASIAEAPPKPQQSVRPSWNDLGKTDQAVHLRAQRFARSRVAEIVLNKSEAVGRGRASASLYQTLREEIDEGRDAFRREFIDSCPSMVDYFHLELVRTLAKEDSHALGPGYPGPLP